MNPIFKMILEAIFAAELENKFSELENKCKSDLGIDMKISIDVDIKSIDESKLAELKSKSETVTANDDIIQAVMELINNNDK